MEENKNKKKKIIIGCIAVVLALLVGVGVYAGTKLSKIKKGKVDTTKLNISKEVDKELGDNYLNVALFGVNVTSPQESVVDSDAVYVVSLNKKTKEVRMFSVYGNTMMKHNGKDIKMKDAYAKGGPEKAISVLNETLRLNIEKYVSINFKAMADAIDILGGIEINIQPDEIPHINGYAQGIAELMGKQPKQVTAAGNQLLDGVQTTGYCRIRVTEGGDVKRGSRQQEVITKMLGKLKEAKFSQMDKIIDSVFSQVETNFKTKEIVDYGKDAMSYKVEILKPYPRQIKPQVRKPVDPNVPFTDYEEIVEGIDVKKDVEEIHGELFPEIEGDKKDGEEGTTLCAKPAILRGVGDFSGR
ncbi:MAG: LCP family protein [Lachnospiraceae bacterium]|nr:LCP family protein [Lachnospiraceae bacterium]